MISDLCKILGLNCSNHQNINIKEVKRAYKKLAMVYHPDKNRYDKNTESKFKEISSAYDTLLTIEKQNISNKNKKIYDIPKFSKLQSEKYKLYLQGIYS